MRLVVTGALGHIGSRLIREVPAALPGTELVLVDDLSTQRYCSLFELPDGSCYRFVEADVRTADLGSLFTNADVVIHLAAITNASASFEIREQVEQVNLMGTERVARACAAAGTRLVFLSTTSVYGSQEAVVDETSALADLRPQSPYAESKLRAEQVLQDLGESDGLDYVVCRFATIFGTSIGMRFHTAINKFCWQSTMGLPLTVWRTALEQQRPYLDLGDATRALVHIVKMNLFDRNIYNVVTVNATVADILEIIRRHVPDVQVEFVDSPIMNQLSYAVSNGKFAARGFHPMGNLEAGIVETLRLIVAAGGGHAR